MRLNRRLKRRKMYGAVRFPVENRITCTKGGVTVSTELLAAKRHAGVWAPVIAWKTIIANTNLAYAA